MEGEFPREGITWREKQCVEAVGREKREGWKGGGKRESLSRGMGVDVSEGRRVVGREGNEG